MAAATRYGNYELIRRLGVGGMAEIYLARGLGMQGFEKYQVIKRILPHLAEDADFIRLFVNEARLAARLSHPNIVQIFNLGIQGGSYFIAMEYVEGEDLRTLWKHCQATGRTVPVALACRVAMDVCAGLDYAHKRTYSNGRPMHIVHCDVSPQNILLGYEGGAIKVADFGLARAADPTHDTRSGMVQGKFAYMSPEQADGKAVDRRTDIFALGVVLHELLTGKSLFRKDSDAQTLSALMRFAVPAPSEVRPDLPTDLDTVVMKALARSPADRYADAAQFQLALERWLLAHQLQSSNARLATFLADVLKERAKAGDGTQGSGSSSSSRGSKGSKPRTSTQMSKSSMAPQAKKPTSTQARATPARPKPAPGNNVLQWALLALASLALLIVLAVSVCVFTSPRPGQQARPPGQVPPEPTRVAP